MRDVSVANWCAVPCILSGLGILKNLSWLPLSVSLKFLPSSMNMTVHIPNVRRTSSMNIFARAAVVMSKVGVDTTNYVS